MKFASILVIVLCWTICLGSDGMALEAPAHAQADSGRRLLLLEAIEFNGLQEVELRDARRALGLRVDEAVDQEQILSAVERLEDVGVFSEVQFYTRPGSQRGRIILVLDVKEHAPRDASSEFRVGTGVSIEDGWYAIPLEFSMMDLLERRDALSLRLVLGYRLAGVEAAYRNQGIFGGPEWWGVRMRSVVTTRIYFYDRLEVNHVVDRSSFTLMAGRPLGRRWALMLEAGNENVEPEKEASVYLGDEVRGIEAGDVIPFDYLPPAVRAAVGEVDHAIAEATLTYDSRSKTLLAGTPRSGLWGRMRMRGTRSDEGDYGQASLDLRTSAAIGGNVLALRAKGVVVGDNAPFYDRLYLGGLYTVRGYPSQSLTPPAGSTWLWSSSIEFRRPLSGDPDRPRLAGSLFLDVGDAQGRTLNDQAVAAGAGWGIRYRLFGILVGIDFAVPLTDTPLDEAFHGNGSIGWSF